MPVYSQTLTVALFTDVRASQNNAENWLLAMRTLVCKGALANGGAGTYLKYSGLGTLASVSIRLDTPPGIATWSDNARHAGWAFSDNAFIAKCAQISAPNITYNDLLARARRILRIGNSIQIETTDYSVYSAGSYMVERFLRTRFSAHMLFGETGNGVGEGYFETAAPP